jgi:hypothetical protein
VYFWYQFVLWNFSCPFRIYNIIFIIRKMILCCFNLVYWINKIIVGIALTAFPIAFF